MHEGLLSRTSPMVAPFRRRVLCRFEDSEEVLNRSLTLHPALNHLEIFDNVSNKLGDLIIPPTSAFSIPIR